MGFLSLAAVMAAGAMAPVAARAALAPPPGPGVYNNALGSPLLAWIDAARASIDIEIYTMEDPGVRQALRAALARRIKVRILKDPSPYESTTCDVFGIAPAGPRGVSSDCQDQRRLVAEVNAAGGVYAPFNKAQLCGDRGPHCFQHGKLLIVDGRIALVSTGNFDPTNLCTPGARHCDRDYTMIVDDPAAVATLAAVFAADLRGTRYDLGALLASFRNQVLTVSQLSMAPLVDFIRSAKQTLRIQNQYVNDPTLLAEILAASKRGVKVFLNVSSACAFGRGGMSPAKIAAVTHAFTDLDAAGVTSRMFTGSQQIDGRPGYLHAKAIIVDDRSAWVGSVNGSTMAITQNREFGVFFRDPRWVSALGSWMSADFADPRGETWQESLRCAKDPGNSDGE